MIEISTMFLSSNKIFLQISLEKFFSKSLYFSSFSVNFESLTAEFHVPYVLNIYIKFRSNRMLFTIQLINLFFTYNFKSKQLEILTFV